MLLDKRLISELGATYGLQGRGWGLMFTEHLLCAGAGHMLNTFSPHVAPSVGAAPPTFCRGVWALKADLTCPGSLGSAVAEADGSPDLVDSRVLVLSLAPCGRNTGACASGDLGPRCQQWDLSQTQRGPRKEGHILSWLRIFLAKHRARRLGGRPPGDVHLMYV